jgi:predicted RNase H-like nuclease
MAVQNGDVVTVTIETAMSAALARLPFDAILGIDIPIGLPRSGDRPCCREARRLLGLRASSVFPVPVRPCLDAGSREAASDLQARIDGRRISVQAWNILPKIREIDALLKAQPLLRGRVFEVHPELCFTRWAGSPMQHSKKTSAGRTARETLIDRRWPGARKQALPVIRGNAVPDDLNDAFAALWTAQRIAAGNACYLNSPDLDAEGLPMRIVS